MSLAQQIEKQKRVDSVQRLEQFDWLAHIRGKLRELATERNDYSGCPIPLEGQRLVIEPTFKYSGLADIGKEEPDDDPVNVRNIFWSRRLRARVAICEHPAGEFWWAPLMGSGNSATAILNTLGASDVWGIEQEHKALELLGTMLRHRQFKQYLLTGSFLETSPRSGVSYVFRKLRPTIAMRCTDSGTRILCTLCMHPIGYYEESWAGCMCPTDDVIAHLTLMRGDEHLLWRRCNQHSPTDASSGL